MSAPFTVKEVTLQYLEILYTIPRIVLQHLLECAVENIIPCTLMDVTLHLSHRVYVSLTFSSVTRIILLKFIHYHLTTLLCDTTTVCNTSQPFRLKKSVKPRNKRWYTEMNGRVVYAHGLHWQPSKTCLWSVCYCNTVTHALAPMDCLYEHCLPNRSCISQSSLSATAKNAVPYQCLPTACVLTPQVLVASICCASLNTLHGRMRLWICRLATGGLKCSISVSSRIGRHW